MALSHSHIIAAAEIVKALNARLNRPNVSGFPPEVNKVLTNIIDEQVVETLARLGVVDNIIRKAVVRAVTCALYIRLEDLLVELKHDEIKLEKL